MAGSKGGRKTKTSRTKQEAWKREERRKENKVEGRTKAKTGKEREEREMWAWDDPAWPRWELTLSGETMARLERIAEEQAALDAEREESVDVQAQSLRDSIVMDSWASSEIEGEWVSSRGLELAYDRPEEGRRTDPKASGVIAMQRMAREAPTIERETLTRMHAALFEEAKAGGRLRAGFSVGDYRKTAIVIRSPERIVYEAPPPEEVEARMGRFLEWYNSGGGGWSRPIASAMPEGRIARPVEAAIGHLWFEAIHPFSDGNGRIGRALADRTVNRGRSISWTLSNTILTLREEYYKQLEKHQKAGTRSIDQWVDWFAAMVERSLGSEREMLGIARGKTAAEGERKKGE